MENKGDELSATELQEAFYHAFNDAFSHMPSMALRCALDLGIPDIISSHNAPVTLEDLVAELPIHPAKSYHLVRVMRLLVHMGYFTVQKNPNDQDAYSLTTLSQIFVSNNRRTTLAPFSLFMSDPIIRTPAFFMAEWFRGPQPTGFEIAHGVGPLEYLKKDLDFGSRYNKTNALGSEVEMQGALKDLIPMLEGFESLVDVAGGTGITASIISKAVPHLRCTVFDLPEVISDINLNPNNTTVTFLAGDVFECIPSADIIFIKDFLASFNDVECLKILKKCCETIQEKNKRGKVIIVDPVKDRRDATFETIKFQLCFDLNMMAIGAGETRTEIEWKELFLAAGFTSYKLTPLMGIKSIIEVFL